MLVLTRKKEQDIVIFDPAKPDELITVRLLEITRGEFGGLKAKIGIRAPQKFKVLRSELHQENRGGGTLGEGFPTGSGAEEKLPAAA